MLFLGIFFQQLITNIHTHTKPQKQPKTPQPNNNKKNPKQINPKNQVKNSLKQPKRNNQTQINLMNKQNYE